MDTPGAMCRAAFTVLGGAGGAIGTAGNPVGTVAMAAAGFVVGNVLCDWKPLRRFFEEKTGVEKIMQDFSYTPEERETAVAMIGERMPGVATRQEAELLFEMTMRTLRARPAAVQASARKVSRHEPPAGKVKHAVERSQRAASGLVKRSGVA